MPLLNMNTKSLDVIRNNQYNERMVTYEVLQTDRRQFLALTGLTLSEFQLLLAAFPRAYQRLYPANQTTEGQPRHRSAGGGCKGLLHRPEDKLLWLSADHGENRLFSVYTGAGREPTLMNR